MVGWLTFQFELARPQVYIRPQSLSTVTEILVYKKSSRILYNAIPLKTLIFNKTNVRTLNTEILVVFLSCFKHRDINSK